MIILLIKGAFNVYVCCLMAYLFTIVIDWPVTRGYVTIITLNSLFET